MALSNVRPPNTPLLPDATRDSIWRRWFEELSRRINDSGGSGTVTSINVAGSDILTFSGGPVTSSGTVTAQTGSILAFAAAHG